jgi:hypothetical protein
MKRIVLLSCVSLKRSYKTQAKDLYISPLFLKSLEYAQQMNPDAIYVLSAKYGLLNLNTEVEPYNVTLLNMPASEVRTWAKNVLNQLTACSDLQKDHFIFLAGLKYRKYLIPYLSSYEIPLEGMPIGKQLQFLTEKVKE